MNYRISAPGFLLAVLLSGGVVPASAQGELSKEPVAQPESSAIAQLATPGAGTAEAALVEGQQAYHQGQLPLALERLSQAIAQFEAASDADGVAAAQVAIAPVHITMENLDEAATAIQAALSYYQAEGNVTGEAQALVNLGALQDSEENYDAALASLQRAAELSKQAQDVFTQGIALLSIGAIYGTQEDYANALPYIDQALPLLRDDSDALRQGYYQASALMFKTICLMGLEEFDQARALVEPIQAINQSLQHPAVDGYLLFIQGTFAAQQGDVDEALSNYQQSIALIQEWGFDRETEVLVNGEIGGIYFEQQDFEQASQAFDRVLAILASQDNILGQLEFLFQIGNLHQENKYYAQAQTYYEAALPFAEATGRAAEGNVLNRIGLMLYFLEQYEQALEFFLPALEAMQDVDDHANKLAVLSNLADTYQQLGELEKAEEYRFQVIAWHQENAINAENNQNYDAAIASLNQLYQFNIDQSQYFLTVGHEYLRSDPQEARNSANNAVEAGNLALNYAEQMLHIAQTQNRADWLPTANYNIALSLVAIGQAYTLEASGFTAALQLQNTVDSEKRALEFYEPAIPFALASNNETIINLAYGGFIGGNYAIGVSYNSIAEHEKAIGFILKALEVSRQVDDRERELNYLSTLDHSYTRLAEQRFQENKIDEALAYLETGEKYSLEIIELSEELEDLEKKDSFIKQALNQLWRVNSKRREIFESQGLYEKALESAYIALDLASQLGEGKTDYTSDSLATIASLYNSLNRHAEALLAYENLEQIASDRGEFFYQTTALNRAGFIYLNQGKYDEAIENFEKSFEIAKDNGIFQSQTSSLTSLSGVYAARGNYAQAMEELTTALALIREGRDTLESELTPELLNQACYLGFSPLSSAEDDSSEDLSTINYRQSLDERRFEETRKDCIVSSWYAESAILHSMGSIYGSQGRYLEALDLYDQALAIDQEFAAGEVAMGGTLSGIAGVYESQGNYDQALAIYEQVLDIYDRTNNRLGWTRTLNNIAIVYENRGQYSKAFDYYQRALAVADELNAPVLRNSIIYNMAASFSIRGNFQDALNTYYGNLEIDRSLGRRADEAIILNAIGGTYYSQGQLGSSSQAYNEALTIVEDIGAPNLEIVSITGLANVAETKGDYTTALNYYQQVLEMAEAIDSQVQTSAALHNLGHIYRSLGQYVTALDYYQRSMDLDVANGSVGPQAGTLSSMAGVYYRQQQYDQAITYHQQALTIHQDAGNLLGQVRALEGIGIAHERQGNYEQAWATYQQALELLSDMDARFLQAAVLGGLGLTRAGLGDTEQAMDYLEQALAINREIGNPAGEAVALADMGKVLAQSGQEDLAIAFYKQAVNQREGIREGIRSLDQALQQSYTDSVAETYRTLADLLLNQGRIPEAQQVLDLLQLEEVRGFTQTRALWTGGSLAYRNIEQPIVEAHGDLIAFGKEFYGCQQTNCDRLDELRAQRTLLNDQYNAKVATFRDQVRQNRSEDEAFLDPDRLGSSARTLLQAHPNSVLIYPFVTDEKLWLLWANAGAYGIIEQDISQGQLARAVQRFGELLTTGGTLSELQAASQQLYDWLIKPLEAPLQANGIEKLIFVNDRVTRYIPMAALFDGEGYLLERYTVSTILSTAQTDTTRRLGTVDEAPVLGLGLTQAVGGFPPLPGVREELTQIVRSPDSSGIFPGNVFLDDAFTLETLERNLLNHRVLHIATHAEFVPGRPGDSFILLWDNDSTQPDGSNRLSVNAINAREHLLENLHMVVLSACQTALGGPAGDGSEIAGISSYFLGPGRAQTVVASLWKVDDGSTSLLMQRFYEFLATGELTKAEALRQAQLSLLYNEDTETRLAAVRGEVGYATSSNREPSTISSQHPYHWAPFILIGNGL